MTISVHSCVRGNNLVRLLEGWWFRCLHVWGVGFRCIHLRSDDSGAFSWGMTISVHSCVRRRIPVHLLEGWWFRCIHVWGVGYWSIYLRNDDFGAFMCEGYDVSAFTRGTMCSVHSCLRGRIPVHSLEEWQFRCIHVWGVGYWFVCPEEWRFRCIHVWGVRFRCIYLRDDDFGAFMCEG